MVANALRIFEFLFYQLLLSLVNRVSRLSRDSTVTETTRPAAFHLDPWRVAALAAVATARLRPGLNPGCVLRKPTPTAARPRESKMIRRYLRQSALTRILILLLFAFHVVPSEAEQLEDRPINETISDPRFFFSVSLPRGWTSSTSKDASSFFRASGRAPSGEASVEIFAIDAKGVVDVRKFADAQTFKNLGALEKTEVIREHFGGPLLVEKRFAANSQGDKALARFIAYGEYGYILLALDRADTFADGRSVFSTFETHIPVAAQMTGIVDYFEGIALFLVVMGAIYLLGKSGQLIRRGVELRRHLKGVERQASEKHVKLNEILLGQYYRKANVLVAVPLLGWIVTYGSLAWVLPTALFLPSLAGLLVPFLGYFGIFFVPSDDGLDYIPNAD